MREGKNRSYILVVVGGRWGGDQFLLVIHGSPKETNSLCPNNPCSGCRWSCTIDAWWCWWNQSAFSSLTSLRECIVLEFSNIGYPLPALNDDSQSILFMSRAPLESSTLLGNSLGSLTPSCIISSSSHHHYRLLLIIIIAIIIVSDFCYVAQTVSSGVIIAA